MKNFQLKASCHSTDLVRFRNHIGKEGFEKIFQMSVGLHGQAALSTVQSSDYSRAVTIVMS